MTERTRLPRGFAVVTAGGTLSRVIYAEKEKESDDYATSIAKRKAEAEKKAQRWWQNCSMIDGVHVVPIY